MQLTSRPEPEPFLFSPASVLLLFLLPVLLSLPLDKYPPRAARAAPDRHFPRCTNTPPKNAAPETAIIAHDTLPTIRRAPQSAARDICLPSAPSRTSMLSRCSASPAPAAPPEIPSLPLSHCKNSHPTSAGLPPRCVPRRRPSVRNTKRLTKIRLLSPWHRKPALDSPPPACGRRDTPCYSSPAARKYFPRRT